MTEGVDCTHTHTTFCKHTQNELHAHDACGLLSRRRVGLLLVAGGRLPPLEVLQQRHHSLCGPPAEQQSSTTGDAVNIFFK